MKKSIIALMGLFMLVACSDETVQETGTGKKTGTEQSTEPQNSVRTIGPLYKSPYFPFTTGGNVGTRMNYLNTTPLQLNLHAYAGELHVQTFLANNGVSYPPAIPLSFSFSPVNSQQFTVPPGPSVSADCGGIISTLIPNPPGCPQGPIVYDFGSPGLNWNLLHYAKIHFFKYEILDGSGSVLASGFLKQRFFTDGLDYSSINSSDRDWEYLTDVTGLPAAYDAVAMYNTKQDEICIAQGLSATATFPSSVTVTDPATGNNYTLEYFTDGPNGNPNGIRIEFK